MNRTHVSKILKALPDLFRDSTGGWNSGFRMIPPTGKWYIYTEAYDMQGDWQTHFTVGTPMCSFQVALMVWNMNQDQDFAPVWSVRFPKKASR